jgi:hypothetical protein
MTVLGQMNFSLWPVAWSVARPIPVWLGPDYILENPKLENPNFLQIAASPPRHKPSGTARVTGKPA